jgi:diketogulonate reductase-like aldo/keto reductase
MGAAGSKEKFKIRDVPKRELLGGVMKPQLGFGTWLLKPNEAYQATKTAIRDYGYRMLDTAKMYQNEEAIGKAIKECIQEGIVKREDLFVTTKLWIDGRSRVEQELRDSLKRLQLDYADLYIMHFVLPNINKETLEVERTSIQDVWRGMEHCQKLGLTRAIGVANAPTVMILELLTFCEIKPAMVQMECHPYMTLEDGGVRDFYDRLNLPLEAYSPLNPQQDPYANEKLKDLVILEDKVIKDLAKKYGKSPA